MVGPGAHGLKRVGYPRLAVVVGMDAQHDLRGRMAVLAVANAQHFAAHCGHRFVDLPGQSAAVGVAEHHGTCAAHDGCLERCQRVLGVGHIAVEEVLGVVNHLLALRDKIAHRVAYHAQVFLERRPQHFGYVQIPRLAEDGDDGGLGCDQQLDLRIIGGVGVGAAGGAEGRHARVLQVEFATRARKELNILGVAAGPAAFNVVHAKLIQAARHLEFVIHGEIHAFALRAVTQGGVVQQRS